MLGQFLGRIVQATAYLGLGEHERALSVITAITEQVERGYGLMDWILRMPLLLATASCRLARGELGVAKGAADELVQLASRPPERTYLAMGRQLLASLALAKGDVGQAEIEVSSALSALESAEAPLAGWRAHETAARLRDQQGRAAESAAHRAQAAATLVRIIESLCDWPELARSMRSADRVRALIG